MGWKLVWIILVFVAGSITAALSAPAGNLLANGDFEAPADAQGKVAGWPEAGVQAGITIQPQGDNHVLSISNPDGTGTPSTTQTVRLDPNWQALELTGRAWVNRIQPGNEPWWQSARVALTWQDDQGNLVTPWPSSPEWSKPTNGWEPFSKLLLIPRGAARLVIAPGVYKAVGEAAFDDLSLTVTAERNATPWVPTFSDDFDGATLDTTKWSVSDTPTQEGQNTLQAFAPDQVTVQDGFLRIRSEKRSHAGREFVSGEIQTLGKFSQLYGRLEMRCRFPTGAGAWAKTSLLPESGDEPPEIDVGEHIGKDPHKLYLTNHWTDSDGNHQQADVGFTDETIDWSQWHTYAIEWEPGGVRWYVDDKLQGLTPATASVSRVPMFLRINSAVGGSFAGNPSATDWPQHYDVDYVRVYRRADQPPPVNAGPDHLVALPENTVRLQGVSCNPMGSTTAAWRKVEGPGPIRFADAQQLRTTATFRTAGTYLLSLTANDGTMSSVDYMKIVVNDRDAVVLHPVSDVSVYDNTGSSGLTKESVGIQPAAIVNVDPQDSPANETLEALLKFDISKLGSVAKATLRIYGGIVYTGESDPLRCDVYAIPAASWDESATFSVSPKHLLTSLICKPVLHYSTDIWYEANITPYIQSQRKAGISSINLVLVARDAKKGQIAGFNSTEALNNRPQLVITPIANKPTVVKSSPAHG